MEEKNKRKIKISFRVTDEERNFIIQKAKLAESSSTGAYIRGP